MWNVKLSIYNVFQPDALNPSSARLSENQAVMCIGCIVSALTRTFEWKMALLSRITAVLYSTPSSLFDHGRRVYSVFPFFSPLENSLSFEMFPSHGLANFLFTPYLHLTFIYTLFTILRRCPQFRRIGSMVRKLEIFGGIFRNTSEKHPSSWIFLKGFGKIWEI